MTLRAQRYNIGTIIENQRYTQLHSHGDLMYLLLVTFASSNCCNYSQTVKHSYFLVICLPKDFRSII